MLRPRRMRAKARRKRFATGGFIKRPVTLRLDSEQVWRSLLEIKRGK